MRLALVACLTTPNHPRSKITSSSVRGVTEADTYARAEAIGKSVGSEASETSRKKQEYSKRRFH